MLQGSDDAEVFNLWKSSQTNAEWLVWAEKALPFDAPEGSEKMSIFCYIWCKSASSAHCLEKWKVWLLEEKYGATEFTNTKLFIKTKVVAV